MNEQLQELVDLFLHRACTPEQEKALFDACLHDPQAAETVRQQLVLSLKIRQLRERNDVPVETRNELFRKINLIAAEASSEEAARAQRAPAFAWIRTLRLGWSHAAVAVVAAAVALFFLTGSPETPQPATQQVAMVTDTVTMHSVDTVREIRKVRVPVYIDRNIARNETAAPDTEQAVTPNAAPVPEPNALADNEPVQSEQTPQAQPTRDMQVTRTGYMAQYNQAVASMDKIQLTEDDRVRF